MTTPAIRILASVLLAVLALVSPAFALTARVTTDADAGPGSFREAVAAANADPSIGAITFDKKVSTIALSIANGSVVYSGTQALRIRGNGATITSAAGGAFDLFRSDGGADLTISTLTFRGGGANGVAIHVPAGAQEDVVTTLRRVTVTENADFGLLIEDQIHEADAGVVLIVNQSTFTANGTAIAAGGNDDRDGIRVNEGGEGDVWARVIKSTFDENAYDGLEIDERGEGSVHATTARTSYDDNGFGNDDDTEDGFDIDEADGGDIVVRVLHSSANGNLDEGFDFSETGEGSLDARLNHATANGNEDEGLKADETEDGDLDVLVNDSRVSESDSQDGVELLETGDGDLAARFVRSKVTDNDNFGIKAEETEAGEGTLELHSTSLTGNGDGELDLTDVTVTKQTP